MFPSDNSVNDPVIGMRLIKVLAGFKLDSYCHESSRDLYQFCLQLLGRQILDFWGLNRRFYQFINRYLIYFLR